MTGANGVVFEVLNIIDDQSLPQQCTPADAYHRRPKATAGDRGDDSHDRVRHDRIGTNGTVTLRHNTRLHTSPSAPPTATGG